MISFLIDCILSAFILGLANVFAVPLVSIRATGKILNPLTVMIQDEQHYCMIMPKTLETDIGDSEHDGGMQTFCSAGAQQGPSQGLIPDDFWTNVNIITSQQGTPRWIQMTGCINPLKLDQLNPSDSGGQYDSSGGTGGQGNPRGSICVGYKHYVELVEPSDSRACIRCCDSSADCPLTQDTAGCPAVIPGEYFDCA